jgi:hypothetical protein
VGRRALSLAVSVGFLLLGAAPASAAPAVGSASPDPWTAVAHWTAARRETARPLAPPTLPGGPTTTATATAVPASITTAGEGIDSGDPTSFPNRANGVVYGEFVSSTGTEPYQCSGSVVDSGAGNLVLTAGHCVIDPETGTLASSLVFVPGYREGAVPYGAWGVSRYVTTAAWAATAGGPNPDEGGDLAFLVLADDAEGVSVEGKVGALEIAFDQSREQTYTQWGYPAEAPYDGEVLYSNTSSYGGGDPSFSPAPMRITSDFTGGASGGPWTVEIGGVPTVLSLTDYTYEFLPHSLYGAYLGAAAREAFEAASGEAAPGSPDAGDGAPPTETVGPTATVTAASVGDGAAPGPTTDASASSSLRIESVLREPARGTATVFVAVGGPGALRLSGPAVRTVSLPAPVAGRYRLKVALAAGDAADRARRRRSTTTVGVWVRFAGAGGVRQLSRLIRLDRRP